MSPAAYFCGSSSLGHPSAGVSSSDVLNLRRAISLESVFDYSVGPYVPGLDSVRVSSWTPHALHYARSF